jgi:hypothetical protein
MIVKVEVANGNGTVRISNEKQTIVQEVTYTADIEKKMGGNTRMFFDATFKKGAIKLDRPVKNQAW